MALEERDNIGILYLRGYVERKNPFWVFPAAVVQNFQDFDELCTEIGQYNELVESLTFSDNYKTFLYDNNRFFSTINCCDLLKVICLKHNNFTDDVAPHIKEFLSQVNSCYSVDLSFNKFTSKGMRIISMGIANNPILRTFNIADNMGIQDQGMKYLADALKQNTVIENLDVSRLSFSKKGEDFLKAGVLKNNSLRYLKYDHITDKCQPIKKRIEENKLKWRENFLKGLKSEETGKWNRSKLMFIGQGRAGKTSTVNRLLNKGFSGTQDSTVGASVSQTQTSTTAEQKWKEVKETDAEFIGKGMDPNKAVDTIAARKIANRKEVKKSAQNQKEKARRLEKERKRRELRAKHKREHMKNKQVQEEEEDTTEQDAEFARRQQEAQDLLLAQELQRNQMDIHGQGMDFDGKMRERMDFDQIKKDNEEDETAKVYADAVFEAARNSKDSITFSLWDYGGQTVFYALHHLFLTKFGIYVLCCDMREILQNPDVAKDYLSFWLNSVKMHASSAPVLLVGTYLDELADKKEVLKVEEFIKENFKSKFTNIVCLHPKYSFYPVDNKNNKGVNDLRFDIERISRRQEFVTADVSLRWLFCLDKMMVEQNTGGEATSWMALSKVKEIGKRVNMGADEVEKMLGLFHELGVLVRLTGTEELRQVVTLEPQWLLNGLCRVIRDEKLHGFPEAELQKEGLVNEMAILYDKGLATQDVMAFLWKGEEYKDHHNFLLDLMKFMVLLSDWDFKGEKMYVIPSLLTPRLEETDLFAHPEEDTRKEDYNKKPGQIMDKNSKEVDHKDAEEEEKAKEPEVRTKETVTDYAVLDFSKDFLPVGVFQRVVCLCVNYSTSIGETGNRVTEPELYERWAKIWMGNEVVVSLEQRGHEIWFSVEDPETAPICLRAVQSMLGRLNNELMGSGLSWDVMFRKVKKTVTQQVDSKPEITEVFELEVNEKSAKTRKLKPWFKKEAEKSTVPDLIKLESFIDSF